MKIDVAHVAKLANLPVTDAEKKKFEIQLSSILEYIEKLNEVDPPSGEASTKNIIPTSQVTGLENVTREDVAKPSLSQEEALSNTSAKHNNLFKVPAILDQ